ncbi:EAL domain-containing protein [Microvirga tunisiensis]|uniref:EAL domain-containing protein n=1 Tax=Pannonibacter tanglangensis TaxID=2750084 RepID=A0A7X5J8Z9_9HYPH|nr:EAL domain-containing protein [Pannonibacter sp. XCT-53]NBN78372.1 EAL domain-containing protein [Pannonibacter sp. XCT-53]
MAVGLKAIRRTALKAVQAASVSCAIAAAVTAAIVIGLHTPGWLQPLERALQEVRFALLDRDASGSVVYADIDAASLQQVGVWPWPRSVHGALVDRLREAGAGEIFFDIDFSSRSTEAEDARFAEALARAEGMVHLAVFRQPADPARPDAGDLVNKPQPRFLAHAWPVTVSLPVDGDGRIRAALFADEVEGEAILSLSAMAAGADGPVRQAFGIDYSIAPASIPRVSVADLLAGRVDVSLLAGRKVVIGASAQELRDFFNVPLHGVLPGALLQILATETLLSGRPMTGGYGYVLLAVVLAAGMAATLCGLTGWRGRLVLFAVLSVGLELGALGVQALVPVSLDTVPAQVALILLSLAALLREIGVRQLLVRLLRRQRARDLLVLDKVFADSFDGVIVIDARGVIRAASRSAEAIWHAPIRSGTMARAVLPPAVVAMLETALARSADSDATACLHEIVITPEDPSGGAGRDARLIEYAITASVLAGEDGDDPDAVACLTCRDITDKRKAEEAFAYLAAHDPITDLLDRRAFEEALQKRLERGEPRGGDYHLLVAGLERIDIIAASLGLSWADKVRAAVARELRQLGCEFVASVGDRQLALAGFPPGVAPADFCAEVLGRISQELVLDGHRLHISACFGLATLAPADKPDAAALLRQAGTALSWARKAGPGTTRQFDQAMLRALTRRRLLEIDLEEGVRQGQFHVVYQPQVHLQSGQIIGVEALLRWQHPELGPVSPAEFIPIAEESGLIEPLGAFALSEACRTVRGWNLPLRLAVNVSPIQVERGSVIEAVEAALRGSGLPPAQLDLELVESLFLGQADQVAASISHLRGLGCGLALDDFGSGYSSLGYIPRFPFSKIKIDRSFVEHVHEDRGSAAIVRSVVELARGFDITVIAEGIETRAQEEAVRRLGCDIGQGYLYGRPMSGKELLALQHAAA